MTLPTPTPDQVKQFTLLYERRFGLRLEPDKALQVATRTLRLYYLATYGALGAKDARPTPERKRQGGTGSTADSI